jgi:hypothetical protein
MKVMRRFNHSTIGFAAFLLLIFATGCSNSAPPAVAPTALSAIPVNAAAGACPNAMVTVTFSEAMNPTTISGTTFTLTGPALATVVGVVSYDAASETATFAPAANLALNTTYTATVTTGAQGMTGKALASNFVWSFTTGNTVCQAGPPTVVSMAPANNATGVCPNTVAVATFGEAMNPSTISSTTFTLTGPGATSVAGAVVYDAPDYVATFTPSSALALNTNYTATVTTGAQDLMGNALASASTWSFTTATAACQSPQVPLGSAATFVVLAGTTVTNTGPTVITGGNLGLSPGSAVVGFPPGALTPPAAMFVTDPTAAQAELDLTTAYIYTAGLPGGAVLAGDMSGLTFAPGLYKTSSAVILSAGNVTLDAQGNVNAVFIFQIGTTLTTSGSTQVILAGGAQAKNVFWQISSEATLGTNSTFEGTIMALDSITLNTGATLNGRALARNAEVALDNNPITAP